MFHDCVDVCCGITSCMFHGMWSDPKLLVSLFSGLHEKKAAQRNFFNVLFGDVSTTSTQGLLQDSVSKKACKCILLLYITSCIIILVTITHLCTLLTGCNVPLLDLMVFHDPAFRPCSLSDCEWLYRTHA